MEGTGTETRNLVLNIETRTKGDLGRPFTEVRGHAARTVQELDRHAATVGQAAEKMGHRSATSLRGLDVAVRHIGHGFQGLTMNLFMASNAMSQAGGHMGKLGEHIQRGVGYLAAFHAGMMLIRGTSHLLGAGLGVVESWTQKTAATTAQLAGAHRQAAVAARDQAAAELELATIVGAGPGAGAGGMSVPAAQAIVMQRRGRIAGGIGAGIGAVGGGIGGQYLAERGGLGSTGQTIAGIGGGVVGAAAGHALAGASWGGAGTMLGKGALGLGTFIGGLEASQQIRNVLTYSPRKKNPWDSYARQGIDYFRNQSALSATEAAVTSRAQGRLAREGEVSQRLAITAPALQRRTQLEEHMGALGTEAGIAGQRARAYPGHEIYGERRGTEFAERLRQAAPQMFAGPGGATMMRELQQKGAEMFASQSQAKTEAGFGVSAASAAGVRAGGKVESVEGKLKDALARQKEGKATDAEINQLMSEREQAYGNLLEAQQKVVDAKKHEHEVNQQNLQQEREFYRAEKQRAQARLESIRDEKRKTGAEFAQLDPLAQARTLGAMRHASDVVSGKTPIKGKAPQVQFVNGRAVMTPGTAGPLSSEEMGMLPADLKRKYGEKLAESNPNLAEYHRLSGLAAQEKEAEQQVEVTTKLENEIKVKIEADMSEWAKTMSEQLVPQLQDIMTMMMEQIKAMVQQQLDALGRATIAKAAAGAGHDH